MITLSKQHVAFIEKHALLLFSILTLLYAICMPDRHLMFEKYFYLLTHQTYLIHDFFEIAGLSATFLNAGFHFLLVYLLTLRQQITHMSGFQIAATGIFVGHSFFGTHILNILPIIFGVICYAKWSNQPFKIYSTLSLFSSCTAPIVSFIAFHNGGNIASVLSACLVGILLGFVTPPLAEEFLKFHQGYTLYNAGFTSGIIGMMVYAVLRYFQITIPTSLIISTTSQNYVIGYITILSVLLVVCSIMCTQLTEGLQKWKKLNKRVGRLPDDFVVKYGYSVTLFNVGFMGILFLMICMFLHIPFNGPILGGFLSVMGFAAFGKHPRNTVPIVMGVVLASYFSANGLANTSSGLVLLFGTSLAPIAGYYGIVAGMLAGFLQFNLTQSVFGLHVGLSLYNNGFASGFVAAFLVPILDIIKTKFITYSRGNHHD